MATEQSVNIKAAATTAIVHVLLFLLFIFISYTTPVSAPVEELGMEVNLGTSDDGSGGDQPEFIGTPAAGLATTSYDAAAQQSEETKDLMHSDDADAPAIAPSATASNKNRYHPKPANNTASHKQQTETNVNNHQQQRPRYVYNGTNGTGGNNATTNRSGSSEGNTNGSGDRGVPGGTPGAANYTGSPGNGTGGHQS